MGVRKIILLMTLFVVGGLFFGPTAQASHFRYGSVNWEPAGFPGEVKFRFKVAFRRDDPAYGSFPGGVDQFAETGDIITDNVGFSNMVFGDGTETPVLSFRVTAFSVRENWIIAEALDPVTGQPDVKHTYSGPGPYTAAIPSCCRIGNLNNRAGAEYRLETNVLPFNTNRSPIADQVPIILEVTVGPSEVATFPVPAVDPDGDQLRWRFATLPEAIFPSVIPNPNLNAPPNMTIDPNTGLVTWGTSGLNTDNFWTVQFMVEDLDPFGNVKTKSPVDFLLRIRPPVGRPPVCILSPPGPIHVAAGTPLSLQVQGSDPDPGDNITLNMAGLPSSNAFMTPALPITGPNSVTSTLNWTPTIDEIGSYLVLFSVTDQNDQQEVCSTTIIVEPPGINAPPQLTISPPGPIDNVPSGTPVTFTVFGSDPNPGDQVTLSTSGLPAGAAMNPSLPTTGPASGVLSTFTWTPTAQQVGANVIDYTATDTEGLQVSKSITVHVTSERPPVVTILPPGPLSVTAGSQVAFMVRGTDPDPGNTVTLNIVGSLPVGAVMNPAVPVTGPATGITSFFIWTPNVQQLGSNIFKFSATDNTGLQAFGQITVTVNPGPNTPPSIAINPPGPITVFAGNPVTFTVTGTDQTFMDLVTLNTDGLPNGAVMDPVLPTTGPTGVSSVFNWTTVNQQAGTTVINFVATDILGAQASAAITIQVEAGNQPPVANAGPDQNPECASPNGTEVTLDGSASTDPDGDTLTFLWNGPFGTAEGVEPVVTLPHGDHIIILTVNDGNGGTDADTVLVTVKDTTPPVITLGPSVELWPPNHKYHTINLAECVVAVVDACSGPIDISRVKITSVSSDEPEDVQGNDDKSKKSVKSNNGSNWKNEVGDGNTLNDIIISDDCQSVQVRSERQGGNNGRVYTITMKVTDEHGNVAVAVCKVSVPHDQRPGHIAIDDGPAAGYTVYCSHHAPAVAMTGRVQGSGATVAKKAVDTVETLADEDTQVLAKIVAPTEFALKPNYPNPFNPSTTIAYDIPQQAYVTLEVYNLLGQVVVRLVDENKAPGRYEVTWNGRNATGYTVASGIYLYRVATSTGFTETRRMTLLK